MNNEETQFYIIPIYNNPNIKSIVSSSSNIDVNDITNVDGFTDSQNIKKIGGELCYVSNNKTYLERLLNGMCLDYLCFLDFNNSNIKLQDDNEKKLTVNNNNNIKLTNNYNDDIDCILNNTKHKKHKKHKKTYNMYKIKKALERKQKKINKIKNNDYKLYVYKKEIEHTLCNFYENHKCSCFYENNSYDNCQEIIYINGEWHYHCNNRQF